MAIREVKSLSEVLGLSPSQIEYTITPPPDPIRAIDPFLPTDIDTFLPIDPDLPFESLYAWNEMMLATPRNVTFVFVSVNVNVCEGDGTDSPSDDSDYESLPELFDSVFGS